MMNPAPRPGRRPALVCASLAALSAITVPARAADSIPETPLITTRTVAPLTMLTVGRDHTLFYEAYNDASDIDGDGMLDTHFKPSITYYGLFDSSLCYSYSSDSSNLFSPVDTADSSDPAKGCADRKGPWSGNWLNYVTTSRIDALRKVLYGGFREVDSKTDTILRRAYIPQDGHSWAKEYTSTTVDGYDIAKYTGLSQPESGKRHFFGNVTMNGNTDCTKLDDCSNLPPLLSVVTNSPKRVWEWASSERLVLNNSTHGGSRTDYTVRVAVCTETFHNDCKLYKNGTYKPVGLLHEYGESSAMLFGLLTGSYNKNMSGGVLRKVVSSFSDEVDPDTGIFLSGAKIVGALNALRIRDFNNGRHDGFYRKGSYRTGIMAEGAYVDWGNPIAEMMYETLRYFAGKGKPTAEYSTSGSHDAAVGLAAATWDDPYTSDSAAKAPWCAKPNMLVVSSSNISYDSDQLPGSRFEGGGLTSDLDVDVGAEADTVTNGEPSVPGSHFIGEAGSRQDFAPTAKIVATLANIRGLAPEEPTKQGSYYAASIAYFAKTHDISSKERTQTADTFVVALASPLPRLEFNVGGKRISLVPFAKTIDGADTDRTKGKYQPTDPIVDLYVEEYSSTHAKFRINYEADEQGNDFDMDVVAEYDITVNSDNTLTISVKPIYESTGSNQNLGYVISGTDRDGVYLVAQDKLESLSYFLNVPPGRSAGYCDPVATLSGCEQLPWISGTPDKSIQTFRPGSKPAATTLENPLWFAAKWGGFADRNGNGKPDQKLEWDSNNDGVPDTYFLVQNPTKLRDALKKSFDSIVSRAGAMGNVTSNGQQLRTDSAVFQTTFNSGSWTGELSAFAVTSAGVSSTALWNASEHLPSASGRNVFTWQGSKGLELKDWSELPAAMQTALGSKDVLNYLRGDQSKEIQNGGTLRTRSGTVLGDLVDSSPYYVKATDTVFVGGNDGMLHAFSAATGAELFAYVPSLVFDKLSRLAAPDYIHTFFVDGDVAVANNILVGSTGRGAKGLYGLNVADPSAFTASDALWEYSGTSDDDMGFVLGRPQLGTLEDGTDVAVVGNGYNSVNDHAVLYVFAASSGTLLKKIDTGADGGNGMSTPTLVDTDGNGKIDTIYAGDLKGNVWRFDVSGTSSKWDSEYKSKGKPAPLFVAMGPSANTQPITAQITLAKDTVTTDPNYGKTFLLFGTGSFVFETDPKNKQVQSWYGIIDDGKTTVSGRAELVERTFPVTNATIGSLSARAASEASPGDMAGKRGWYLDLSAGERIVTRSILITLLEPVLIASSIIPNTGKDRCDPAGGGYVNSISPFTGGRLKYVAFDLNGDGHFDGGDKIDGKTNGSSYGWDNALPGEPVVIGNQLVTGLSDGNRDDEGMNGGKKHLGRISWREIIRN